MDNFKRIYELVIGRPPTIDDASQNISIDIGTHQVVSGEGDYRTVDLTEAIVITELSLKGNIHVNKQKSNGQPFVFELKGFSSETESYIQRNSVVILKAGYASQDAYTLFVGQIYDYNYNYDTEIPVVRVSCTDGYTTSNSVKISKNFPESISYLDILNHIANVYAENRIPLGRDLEGLTNKTGAGDIDEIDNIILEDGYTIPSSYLDEALSSVCSEIGYTYYFSKSRLFIEPENYISDQIDSFELLPEHIISVVPAIPANNMNAKDTQEGVTGFKIKTLLDGRVDIGDVVNLKVNDKINGTFKVVSLQYELDYEGQAWYNSMELSNA